MVYGNVSSFLLLLGVLTAKGETTDYVENGTVCGFNSALLVIENASLSSVLSIGSAVSQSEDLCR